MRRRAAIRAGLVVMTAHLLLVLPLPLVWRGVGALLLLALPGVMLAVVLFGAEHDPLTMAFLGLCGGIALPSLLILALQAVPGPLSWWMLLLSSDILSGVFGWLLLRQQPAPSAPPPRRSYISAGLGAVLLLGAVLRLTFLGGAEFAGDEIHVLLLSVDMLRGRDDILLLHTKGPIEALLPAGLLGLVGNINEWAARLPFALAGIGVLLGAYLLAKRMLRGDRAGPASGAVAGVLAAAILALDGFLIAFSRLVQYQNVVVLMMLGALWCCWRFYEGAVGRRYLICAAALAAISMLAHYDGGFVVPALAWLVLAGGRRRRWRAAQWLGELGLPLLIGASLLASFYLPFAIHEHFGATLRNIAKRTGQHGGIFRLFNNLIPYERVATFYNTTFQIHWLALVLLAAGLVWLGHYGRPRVVGWALAALLLLGSVLLVWDPGRFKTADGGNWAIVAFSLPLLGLALSPATPTVLRTLVLWFAPPFIAESFLFVDPKTHFYTMDTAAALLIGLAVVWLVHWLRAHRLAYLQAPLIVGGGALLLLATPYLYLVFVRQAPEYKLTFPAERPEIYRASYQDQLVRNGGYYGFPHRAGWKVIGELYRQGVLRGDFDSNEDWLITHWYTHSMPRCSIDPAYYFLAQRPIDFAKVPIDQIQARYQLFGVVMVDGVKQIEIYSRQPQRQPVQVFDLHDYIHAFDANPVARFSTRPAQFIIAPQQHPQTQWQRGVLLQEHGLDYQRLAPDETATFWFHWQASEALDREYAPFVEVVDRRGTTVAGAPPMCTFVPPAEWHSHDSNQSAFILTADATIPPGLYTVRVGLRKTQTGARLPLMDGSTALSIATITVAAL